MCTLVQASCTSNKRTVQSRCRDVRRVSSLLSCRRTTKLLTASMARSPTASNASSTKSLNPFAVFLTHVPTEPHCCPVLLRVDNRARMPVWRVSFASISMPCLCCWCECNRWTNIIVFCSLTCSSRKLVNTGRSDSSTLWSLLAGLLSAPSLLLGSTGLLFLPVLRLPLVVSAVPLSPRVAVVSAMLPFVAPRNRVLSLVPLVPLVLLLSRGPPLTLVLPVVPLAGTLTVPYSP